MTLLTLNLDLAVAKKVVEWEIASNPMWVSRAKTTYKRRKKQQEKDISSNNKILNYDRNEVIMK